MGKALLLINQKQFGYHSDTFYYCKYLRHIYDITFLCWDYDKPKISLDGVRVRYVSRRGNLALRNLRFIMAAIRETRYPYPVHMVKYFRGCSLLKLIYPTRAFLVDIRSAAVGANAVKRIAYNLGIRIETALFKEVSVISKGLAQKLGLAKRAFILPLGADMISMAKKRFLAMHLLYVGTLHNRNIHQALEGFIKFYRSHHRQIDLKFTIVGSGYGDEEAQLRRIALEEKCEGAVDITGQIPHTGLGQYFDSHNIGVSYIPKTDYFDFQPPTKTFEYLLSGMPVLATDTFENRAVVNHSNGILIHDSAADFYEGLVRLHQGLSTYDSNAIRFNARMYTWDKIASQLHEKLAAIQTES